MSKHYFLHSYLFGLFPVLFLFSQNAGESSLAETFLPLVIVMAGVFIASRLLRLWMRDHRKAQVMVTVFLVFFFSYGQIIDVFSNLRLSLGAMTLGANAVVFPVWTLLLTATLYLVTRLGRALAKVTTFLNISAATLVSFQFVMGCYALTSHSAEFRHNDRLSVKMSPLHTLPDIYYIILDDYGRRDVLQEIYDYDNGDFLDFLEARGFYVADRSRSNYCATDQSLTSALNLDYIQNLGKLDPNSSDRMAMAELLADNAVCRFLKERGYSIGVFNPGIQLTELEEVDVTFKPGVTLSEFENSVVNLTPVPYLLRGLKSQYDAHRDRIDYALKKLPRVYELQSPKFVFAHLMCPHPPFVYAVDGTGLAAERPFTYGDGSHFFEQGGTPEEYVTGYRNQAAYLSARLRTMIGEILQGAATPPIIIVQGDHGPGSKLDWQNAGRTDLFERFSILNAYYFPDHDYRRLYADITPVNSFRLILSQFFGADLERLPDKSFFTARTRPYLFIPVDDYIRK